jgi:hypothetical protein
MSQAIVVSRRGGSAGVLVNVGRKGGISLNNNNKTKNNGGATMNVARPVGRARRRGNGGNTGISAAYPVTINGGKPTYGGGQASLTVTHTESLGELLGSAAFAANYYMLIPATFPWLRGVAQNFSRYRWKKLEFSFITSSPTSQSGHVAMGALYDWNDAGKATSIADIHALSHSFLSPVWNGPGPLGVVRFDPSRWNKPWYSHHIPTEDFVASEMYVPGWLAVGRHTQVNGQSVGHMVVSYQIEFLDPLPAKFQPTLVEAQLIKFSGARVKEETKVSTDEIMSVLLDRITRVLESSALDSPTQSKPETE